MASSNSSVTRTETTTSTVTTTSILTSKVTVCTPSPSYIFTLAERPNATISSLTNASSMEGKSRKFTTTSKASIFSLEVIAAVTSIEAKLSIATAGMTSLTLQETTPLPQTKTTTDAETRTATGANTLATETTAGSNSPTTTPGTRTTETETVSSSTASVPKSLLKVTPTTGTEDTPTTNMSAADTSTTHTKITPTSGEATSAQGLPDLTVSAPTTVTVVQAPRMDTAKASVTNTATSTPLSKVSYPSTVITPNKPVTTTNTEGITPSTASVITTITSAVALETAKTSSTKTLNIGSTKSATPTATSSTKTTAILTVKGTATTPSTVLTEATIGSTATEIIALAPTTAYRSENMPSIVSLVTTISSEVSSVIKATTSRKADASSSERTFILTTSATATTPTQEVPPTLPLDAPENPQED